VFHLGCAIVAATKIARARPALNTTREFLYHSGTQAVPQFYFMLHTVLVVVSCPARRKDTEKLSVRLLTSIPMYMKISNSLTPKTEDKIQTTMSRK
jgi:hypothetical protein